MKKFKRIFKLLVLIFSFLLVIFHLIEIIPFDLFRILAGFWVCGMLIASGIIGLITNSILLSRGGDLEYKPKSTLGKIGNYAIIIMGIVLLIAFIRIY